MGQKQSRNTNIILYCLRLVGRDGSVGIVNRYGLDGPGIEFRCGRDFLHPSRLALGPTQPPIQWVPGSCCGVALGPPPPTNLVPRLKKE